MNASGRPDWGQHYWIRVLVTSHGARQPGRPLQLYHTFGDWSGEAMMSRGGHPNCRRHLCETVRCGRDQLGRPEECYHSFETIS